MKKCLFFLLVLQVVFSQESNIPLSVIDTITITSENYIGTDTYGFVYENNKEVLLKKKGTANFQYKNVALGTITKIDLLNPLQIVLLYANFNTIVVLDNQFNETFRINLSEQNTPIVASAAGLAAQNKMWLFNEVNQQLVLFDKNKNKFTNLSQPFKKKLIYYQTSYNYFYWIDTDFMMYSCDLFGKVNFLGNVPIFDNITIISDQEVILSNQNQLSYYNLTTKKTKLIDCCKKTFKSYSYKNQILTIFTDNKISYYKIDLN